MGLNELITIVLITLFNVLLIFKNLFVFLEQCAKLSILTHLYFSLYLNL